MEGNTKVSEVTTLWRDYQNGVAYQESSGLAKKLPKFVKFYEGDQWPAPTKNTRNLPRPVVNIIKMICRNKKSAILSVPVKIVYKAEEHADVEKFNNFADYIQKEYGQEALDKKAIDDAVKKGSYFYHYFWDSEAKGKDGTREGGLRCEIIDPLNIFFSDPTELDEQKQEWILIASRENVNSIQAKCDEGVDKDLIVSDLNEDKYHTVEQEGDKLCTVLTRYFRKNGEVFSERATKSVVVNKPRALTPNIREAERALGFIDAPNNSLPDSTEDRSLIPKHAEAILYPVVAGSYEIRERSIYGLGEVEGLIPNQKAINFNLAMVLLNNQEMAWGKYIVHPNALKGQVITNEPGQTLIDYSGTNAGIKKMTEHGISSQPLQIIETLTELTRIMTGSTEVMTGEAIGAGMSGAAIAQLQAQAQAPVEELREAFWLVKEKQGKVLAQFFKLYYAEKEFSFLGEEIPKDELGNEIEGAEPKETTFTDTFNSTEYSAIDFSVVVEATSGTKGSAAGDINALDILLSKGAISPKTYFEAYPDDALTNKSEILKALKKEEESEIRQLTAELQRLQQENEMLTNAVKEQKETVDKVVAVIQENNSLKMTIASLCTEATEKVRAANRQIQLANSKIAETTKDASEMASFIAKGGTVKDVVAPAGVGRKAEG